MLNDKGSLKDNVGRWLSLDGQTYEAEWEWWVDKANNSLLRCVAGTWYKFQQIQQRKKRRGVQDQFKTYVPLLEPPQMDNLVRASVKSIHGAFITQGYDYDV